MITIDGSAGEGGGQVLRTALTMSLATGRAFRIDSIRAGRPKPGLMRQHLTAVNAAAAISQARVEGADAGSRSLTFSPSPVEGGAYTFSVGTAGSATLVAQTVVLPLLLTGRSSTLTFEGGTHNPWAPPFDFFNRVWLPIVNRLGPTVEASLDRHGFYPAGGGRFAVSVRPAAQLARLELIERGEITGRTARVVLANLPRHIAERELSTALRLLNWPEASGSIESVSGAPGPGNVVMIEIVSDHITEISTGFGELRTTAEGVADKAAKETRRYLAAGVPVGTHLADQLLPLLAVGCGGSFRTLPLTRHAATNADVIRQFIDVDIAVAPDGRDTVRVDVRKR